MPSLKDLRTKAIRRIRNAVVPKTDWTKLLSSEKAVWAKALAGRDPRQKILIPTGTGGHEAVTAVESLLAIALTLRGADVHFLLCDAFLPACQMQTYPDLTDEHGLLSESKRQALCRSCVSSGKKLYSPLGLPIHRYSELVRDSEADAALRLSQQLSVDDILSYEVEGQPLGEQAQAGALRFFARGDLKNEPQAEALLRRYFQAALLTRSAFTRLFSQYDFSSAFFHHGLYVPQGIIGGCARKAGVRIANWNVAYRRQCVIFSHDDTYHHTLMNEPVSHWENLQMTAPLNDRLQMYLKKRESGSEDWISFHVPQEEQIPRTHESAHGARPYALLLTNVLWDAQLHYPANAFSNMMEWILETIRYFTKRTELDLVIRIHPAELTGIPRSRQTVQSELKKAFGEMPNNVRIIGPADQANTYDLARGADAVLIYGTKTGVELAAGGIPVIVAGEAWIRNKGISTDVSSAQEYRSRLDQLPLGRRLDERTQARASRYAFHFFFRRMIPLKCLSEREGLWPPLRATVSSLDQLLPGRDAGLDVICDGILTGSEFIYPDERSLN